MESLSERNKNIPETLKQSSIESFEFEKEEIPNEEKIIQDINSLNEEIQVQEKIISNTIERVNAVRDSLGLEREKNIPSLGGNKKKLELLNTQISRFNLQKPEDHRENKKKSVSLRDQQIPEGAKFDDLHKTGQKFIDEDGVEKTIKATNYTLSNNIDLHIRGRDFRYRDKNNQNNYISAEYNKNSGELEKMHFESENSIFAGKAIMDMIDRIPSGTEVLGHEVSMSSDSFPLLLNTLNKYLDKDPNRFSVSQIDEFVLNDNGKYSDISKSATVSEKVRLLNDKIKSFREKSGLSISDAHIVEKDGEYKIIIPKIKIIKNY